MCEKYPKVLVISHNAFSKTLNNGKTYSSIFSEWPKEKIAQLYFQNENPNFEVCENYFKIVDEDIISKKKAEVGMNVIKENKEEIKKTDSSFHNFARKKPLPILSFIRDMLWSTKKWDNLKLENWLENFKPEVIFFVGGGASFSYKITKNIADKFNIPIFLYYTDDYISPLPTIDLFWWLNWVRLNSKLNKLKPNIKKVFVIGEDMAEEYSRKLNKSCVTIMNAVDTKKYLTSKKSTVGEKSVKELSFAYFGGLHLNRWKSLAALGKSIEDLSKKENVKVSLSIYTMRKPDDKIMKLINKEPYIRYAGSVNESQIIEEMQKYDVLVHVESFNYMMKRRTRLSISTKIPEYLASSKPILAIGPKSISSIKYLNKIKIAYVLSSLNHKKIKAVVVKILKERNIHESLGEQGMKLAEKNHSLRENKTKIRKALSEDY